jgi:hypothetical protein
LNNKRKKRSAIAKEIRARTCTWDCIRHRKTSVHQQKQFPYLPGSGDAMITKEAISKITSQSTGWEKILTDYFTVKKSVLKTYKVFKKPNTKTTIILLRNRETN